jgi:TPR repeat protein
MYYELEKENKIKSFYWYKQAADAGDVYSAETINRWIENNYLSPSELEQVNLLFVDGGTANCKEEILGEWEPRELEIH